MAGFEAVDLNRLSRSSGKNVLGNGVAGEFKAETFTVGASFNDLFVLFSFSLIIYFLVTGAFVLMLAALFFLALFYSPPQEKKPDRKDVSL